ncbi:DUF481 domain-containing protein [Acidipila sp. EB88]|uniref:DUF481 domain-containing protein n=1 Tax=Acidipila sp. EB88 TaxID=2305226 RepID=UPI00131507B9|nr:DUF481 domain-containing protein [Acidipila sp. EB88]
MPNVLQRAVLAACLLGTLTAGAQTKAEPDTIDFTNGDHLTGKLVREAGGSVVFHSDIAGDLTVSWDKIKALHASEPFAVLQKGVVTSRKLGESQIPIGAVNVTGGNIELQASAVDTKLQTVPVAQADYIIDKATLDKQLLGHPGFFEAWNGSATGGVTIVSATQNQYTVTAAAALQRTVPTVSWLDPRNRTTLNLNESFGRISEPAYTVPATTTTAATLVPATFTKSNIFHTDAERDEYLSKNFYYLGDLSFDHNYSQSLQLQQIYGAGVGRTLLKTPKQELDVKVVAQYEKQAFFNSASANQNLIAATVAANYNLTLTHGILFNQQVSYIPAFNNTRAYSATENDTLTFPAYKNFGFTVGTLDSYLNDAPVTLPETKRNSFQFTIGATYSIKSKY